MDLGDIQRWETYKGFRIVPSLLAFDSSDAETKGRWIVLSVCIRPAEGGDVVRTLRPKGLCRSTKDEAFMDAVILGKKEIDDGGVLGVSPG